MDEQDIAAMANQMIQGAGSAAGNGGKLPTANANATTGGEIPTGTYYSTTMCLLS